MGNGSKCKRSVWLSERGGGERTQRMYGGNDEIKVVVRRKEATWKEVLQLEMKRQKKDV